MKVGVIGLGHGSRVLIKAFNLGNFEIYGVSSKTNKKTVELNENYKIYNNWIDLIKDRKIKIIAIAVPPYLQPKILNECIKYKKIIEYKNVEIAIIRIINKKIHCKEFDLFYDLYIEYVKNNYDDLLNHIENIFNKNKDLILIESIYKMKININNKKNLNDFLNLQKKLNLNKI